jgi:hypothetical protein
VVAQAHDAAAGALGALGYGLQRGAKRGDRAACWRITVDQECCRPRAFGATAGGREGKKAIKAFRQQKKHYYDGMQGTAPDPRTEDTAPPSIWVVVRWASSAEVGAFSADA